MHDFIIALTSLMDSELFKVLAPVGLVTSGAYLIGKEVRK